MMHGSLAPILANLSVASLPRIFEWALNFLIQILCDEVCIACILYVMKSLSRWLSWEEGFLICLSSRYKLFRLFVKMYVSIMSVLVCYIARSRAYNSALRIFGQPHNLATIFMQRGPLNTLEHNVSLQAKYNLFEWITYL